MSFVVNLLLSSSERNLDIH